VQEEGEAAPSVERVPPDNLEIVRRGYEAINAGDLEAAFAHFDPRAEIRPGVDVPDLDFEDVYYGPEGFGQFHAKMAEAWEEPRWEPEEYIPAGDDIVVFIRFRGVGKGSGVPVDQQIGHVCTMRDGKLVKHVTYWDRNLALEAAGLQAAE
jgi:ketosteroid isomerase-like protein